MRNKLCTTIVENFQGLHFKPLTAFYGKTIKARKIKLIATQYAMSICISTCLPPLIYPENMDSIFTRPPICLNFNALKKHLHSPNIGGISHMRLSILI